MIKIIEKGTRQVRECINCGCKFSFDKEDIECTHNNSPLGKTEEEIIRCPQCKTVIHLRGTK